MSMHSVLRLHSQDAPPLSKDMMTKQTTRKLEIFSGDALVSELPLNKTALSIGRDPEGDVLLLDPQISRQHARLTQISSNYFIEDCDSTNGTLLNGRPVNKHVFRPGDSLRIGNFELRYVVEEDQEQPDEVVHAVVRPVRKGRRARAHKGMLFFLQGPEAGQVKSLKDPLFTIGRPGESVAVVALRAHGTFLLHIGGDMPEVNGEEVTKQTVQLQHGDVIDVGEHQIKITLD